MYVCMYRCMYRHMYLCSNVPTKPTVSWKVGHEKNVQGVSEAKKAPKNLMAKKISVFLQKTDLKI